MGGKTQAMRAQVEEQAATGPRWFVVQCHAGQERQARQNLKNSGFEVYLPMRLNHPRAKRPISPFFPRYMFLRFDPSITQWLDVISTVGVHDIIRKVTVDGRVPRAVPDHWIERIREWEIEGVIHLLAPPKREAPVFRKGDLVRIKGGPFEGFEGLVHVANDNDRVTIFLALVARGESVKVELAGRDLEKSQACGRHPGDRLSTS